MPQRSSIIVRLVALAISLCVLGAARAQAPALEQPWLDEFPTADAVVEALAPKTPRRTDNPNDIAARQVATLLHLRDAILLLGGATDHLGGEPTRALTPREAALVAAYERTAAEITERTTRGLDGDFVGSPKPSDAAFTTPAANYRANASFQRSAITRHFSRAWQSAYPPIIAARQKAYDDARTKEAADAKAAEREAARAAAAAEREAQRKPPPAPPSAPSPSSGSAAQQPIPEPAPISAFDRVHGGGEDTMVRIVRLVMLGLGAVALVVIVVAWAWAMGGAPRLGTTDPLELEGTAFRLGTISGIVGDSDKSRAVWSSTAGSVGPQGGSVSTTVHRETVNEFRLHRADGGVRDIKLVNWDVAVRPGDPVVLFSLDLKEGRSRRWFDPQSGTIAYFANGSNGERYQREGAFRELLTPSPKTGVLFIALGIASACMGWVAGLFVVAGVLFLVHRWIVGRLRLGAFRREWLPTLRTVAERELATLTK